MTSRADNRPRAETGGLGLWLRELVAPTRRDRAVPLGRAAIVSVVVASTIFLFYTLLKDAVPVPFVTDRYTVEIELPYGAGLDPSDSPAVGVAGINSGRVTDVRYEDGKAIVTASVEPYIEGKVFRDARVELRPINIVNILAVNVLPGDPQTGPLPDGGRIPAARTSGFVATDKVTDILDADTRAYAQILVGEAARALDGRGGDVERALERLGPLTDSGVEVSRALVARRRLVSRFVDELEVIFRTLAQRRTQLARAVDSGTRVLSVTSGRERELAAAVRELPPTLVQTRSALAEGRALADPLRGAVQELAPAADDLAPALEDGRDLLPVIRRLLDATEVLVTDGRKPTKDLRVLAGRLGTATETAVPALEAVNGMLEVLVDHAGGYVQLADLFSGANSSSDLNGIGARVINVEFETPKPENFGLPKSAGRRAGAEHSPLERRLARALEHVCAETNPVACLVRFQVPGLPDSVTGRDGAPAAAPTDYLRSGW